MIKPGSASVWSRTADRTATRTRRAPPRNQPKVQRPSGRLGGIDAGKGALTCCDPAGGTGDRAPGPARRHRRRGGQRRSVCIWPGLSASAARHCDQEEGTGTEKGDTADCQAIAHGEAREAPATVLNSLVDTVRPTGPAHWRPGRVGRVGRASRYVPADRRPRESLTRRPSGPCSSYRAAAERHDHRGPGEAELRRLPRTAPGPAPSAYQHRRQGPVAPESTTPPSWTGPPA